MKSVGISLYTSATSHLIFARKRCVTSMNTEGHQLRYRPHLYHVVDPIETHNDLFKHGYIMIVWNLPFPFRRTVNEISPLTAPYDLASWLKLAKLFDVIYRKFLFVICFPNLSDGVLEPHLSRFVLSSRVFNNKSSQRVPNTPVCQNQWMLC